MFTKPVEATFNICNTLPWLPQCNPSPSVSPSPSPSVEPSPSVDPCLQAALVLVDVNPCASPEPSESPSVEPSQAPGGFSQPDPQSPPADRACAEIKHAPTVTSQTRVSPTSYRVTWTKTDPIDDYRVFYGLSAGALVWSVGVENTHEVTLNGLPENKEIEVRVYGTDGLCLGQGSTILPKAPPATGRGGK